MLHGAGIFYLHDWVILFGQMLVCIYQHHGASRYLQIFQENLEPTEPTEPTDSRLLPAFTLPSWCSIQRTFIQCVAATWSNLVDGYGLGIP